MASSSLGRLTLDLAVKIGAFEEGLSKAERKTKQTTDSMGEAFSGFKNQVADALGGTQLGSIIDGFNNKLGSIKGGVGVASAAIAGMAVGGIALSAAGLSKMAIETARANNELQVLANRANTSLQSFQVLQYAASTLGITQDQLGSILADTQEKLGEFSATQGGGAADFFDALKNNTKMSEDQIKSFAKTLQGKDGVEAIQMLNNKMDELGVTSQERRFIFESLASDLSNLVPLFSENGRAINEFDIALRQAGLLTTKEAAEQSQVLAAQVQAVNLQFQGWKNQLVSGFMPAIIDVANAFFSTSKNGQQLQSVGAGIGSVMKAVAKVALGVSAAFTIAGKVIGGVAAAIAALKGDKIATINLMFDDIEQTLADYGNRIDSFSIIGDSATKSTNNLVNAIVDVNKASKQSAQGLALDTKTADENAKAKEKAAKESAKLAKEQAKLNGLVGASALTGLRIKSSEAFAGGQVRGYTANFAQMAQKQLGSNLTRFTAFNDSYHKGTNSKHATGNAFDFTIADASKSAQAVSQLESIAKRYGYVVKVLDEYKNPSSRATGGHLHVSVLGFKGTAEAAKQAQDELNVIAQTNEEADRIKAETLRTQQSVMSKYFSDEEKLTAEHQSNLKEIEKAFGVGTPRYEEYLAKENTAYKKSVDQYKESLTQKSLEEKKQLLEVRKNWMTAGDYAEQYYALVREEILNTSEYSPEMKDALIQQANYQQNTEQAGERDQAVADYRDVMGYEESPLIKQYEILDKMRKLDLINEEAYQNAKLQLQTKSTASYMEGMIGGFASLVDENSKTYAVLFAAQKAFAVAQAMLNIPAAYSKAYDAVVGTPYIGPYIAPAVGAAAAALQVAQAASIRGVNISGMAHNGIDNIPKEGTWLLDGGERVLNPQQNKDLTNYLANKPADGQANVNLNPNFVIVDERQSLGDYLYGPDGKKAFVKFFKQNRRELGLA